jgi:hypothetical protein
LIGNIRVRNGFGLIDEEKSRLTSVNKNNDPENYNVDENNNNDDGTNPLDGSQMTRLVSK